MRHGTRLPVYNKLLNAELKDRGGYHCTVVHNIIYTSKMYTQFELCTYYIQIYIIHKRYSGSDMCSLSDGVRVIYVFVCVNKLCSRCSGIVAAAAASYVRRKGLIPRYTEVPLPRVFECRFRCLSAYHTSITARQMYII